MQRCARQLWNRAVKPAPNTWIVFELAQRLGLGAQFWNGDIDTAWRHMLAPTSVSLEALRQSPEGIRTTLRTRIANTPATARHYLPGFATPTRKVEEVYSESICCNTTSHLCRISSSPPSVPTAMALRRSAIR